MRGRGRREKERKRLYPDCIGGRGGPSSAGGLLSHLHTRSHIRSWITKLCKILGTPLVTGYVERIENSLVREILGTENLPRANVAE